MPMSVQRWLWSVAGVAGTLLAVSAVSFLLVALLPGDVAVLILADSATPERVAALREQLGLDQPLPVRYLQWLGNVLSGDLGRAIHSGEPTLDVILSRLPVTIELILLSVNINLVAFSAYLHDLVGQIFAMFVLTVAAGEAAIGLAILVIYFRGRGTIAVDDINRMKG